MDAFDDVLFPLEIGQSAEISPGFSTSIVTTASGHEQRNMAWASGRMRYDVGTGLRSESDLRTLLDFFRARRGAAKAFRFRDPLDHDVVDQALGMGDGVATRFALIKSYGSGPEAEQRRITRPAAAGMIVKLDGVAQTSGWSLGSGGVVDFAVPPPVGAAVSASFSFDVPVRFAIDALSVDLRTFLAGDVPSVPLIEVREDIGNA